MYEPAPEWFQSFFDDDYLRVWGAMNPDAATDAQVAALVEVLDIRPGMRVLDAPCGYGRVSRRLAARGARVVGLDLSPQLLTAAERDRGDLDSEQLRYLRHDLREPVPDALLGIVEPGMTATEPPEAFDVVLNLFSSVGYGADDDDARIFENMAVALKPGGALFVDTMHRDALVANLARGSTVAFRTDDGTLVIDTPVFDAFDGTVTSTWYWSGPRGSGEKQARLRLYTVTELVRLLAAAGLDVEAAYAGCSTDRFEAKGPSMGGRIGLLARKR